MNRAWSTKKERWKKEKTGWMDASPHRYHPVTTRVQTYDLILDRLPEIRRNQIVPFAARCAIRTSDRRFSRMLRSHAGP
jgi:hypothetical protein